MMPMGVIFRSAFTMKFPNLDQIQGENHAFGIGKFQGFQIDELKVYGGGIIVSAKCNTELLLEFVSDLFGWLRSEFDLEQAKILEPEMYFESGLTLLLSWSPPKRVSTVIEKALARQADYQATGITYETNSEGLKTRRLPVRFAVERRWRSPSLRTYFTAPLL